MKLSFYEVKRFIYVVLSTLLYIIGVYYFLTPIQTYSGGITGLAQLFVDGFKISTDYWFGIIVFLLNIPLLILAVKTLSKTFAFYSIVSVILQSVFLIILPQDFINQFNIEPITSVIMGSILTGAGIAFALKIGASTGGFDIISQYLALKKQTSFGFITLIFNLVIAIIGGLINKNLTVVIYTFLRILLSSIVIDKIHTSYNFIRLDIVTTNGDELCNLLLSETHHGVTRIKVQGAYTKSDKDLLVFVISSFEVNLALRIIKEVDPLAFVTMIPLKKIHGNFKRKVMQ